MFDVKIEYSDSFKRKTSKDAYEKAIMESLDFVGDALLKECKNESPVRTGRLRDGHYIEREGFGIYLCNNVEYAPYVIYGTSRQSPNNYPQRVVNRLNVNKDVTSRFRESLMTQNIL